MRGLLVRYGLAMTSVVLVAFLVPLGLLARSLAHERALGAAGQDAQSVAVFAGGVGADDARLEAAVLAVDAGERSTTVFLPDGSVVGPPAERTDGVALASLGRAATVRADGGVEVLLPVGGAEGFAVVRTFVPDAELDRGVVTSWLVLGGVGVVLLLGTAVAGHRIAGRVARSVLDLAAVAGELGAGRLDARVRPSGPPEVASVGQVLNGLGAQVSGLLAAERELVADLSHRLRTPITALRLDADALEDADERARMGRHVDELVAAVDTVIRTARTPSDTGALVRCDVAEVVRERARFWSVLAAHQGRALHVDVPDRPVPVGVGAQELGATLDVLVDNVFSHTPDGTGFALTVADADGRAVVTVADEGPGFPEASAARGRSGGGSTGLGLDVARRTAESAGGGLTVTAADGGGALVRVDLGPTPPG